MHLSQKKQRKLLTVPWKIWKWSIFSSLYLFKYLNLKKAKDSKHPVNERADFFSYLPNWLKTEKVILQVINRRDIKCSSQDTTTKLQTNAKRDTRETGRKIEVMRKKVVLNKIHFQNIKELISCNFSLNNVVFESIGSLSFL